MINIISIFLVFFIAIAIMMCYCMHNLTSTIIESKWDINTWINNTDARLMEGILINRNLLKEINEKEVKVIENIKNGDEIVDENNDFYFVTYVYGDKVDGISKEGIVREGMEIGKVKKTGKHAMVRIDTTIDEKPDWI